MTSDITTRRLLAEIRRCTLCAADLDDEPRPLLTVTPEARILIAGQAPGRSAYRANKPFADVSGERLRDWLGVDEREFYDPALFAIVPMGFCYPGSAAGGDKPPRRECAETWRARVLAKLRGVELTLVVGRYALGWHLPAYRGIGDAVADWRSLLPSACALPHPSPRNAHWPRRRPWFERELLPALRRRVRALVDSSPDRTSSTRPPASPRTQRGRRRSTRPP